MLVAADQWAGMRVRSGWKAAVGGLVAVAGLVRSPVLALMSCSRSSVRFALLASIVFAVALQGAAFAADRALPTTLVTNGSVNTVLAAGNTVYIGGSFSYVGQNTGAGVPLDAGSGSALGSFSKINGEVYAAVSDGAGGFYVGGSFLTVGGVARENLVHVRADGRLDASWPSVRGEVDALAASGQTVYVGGDFNSIGGRTRERIAAVDARTGTVTAWNPGVDVDDPQGQEHVSALAVSGSTVYAGGSFHSIGGQDRENIAALDASTGKAIAWNPSASGIAADGAVLALAVSGEIVYAGGYFTWIGGEVRDYIAALEARTGKATAWDPSAGPHKSSGYGAVLALAVSGETVYAGGDFSSIGGEDRENIAALDASTGEAAAWNPSAADSVAHGAVSALAVSGQTVYAGGYFTSIGGQPREKIAALDASTGQAGTWNPGANGDVRALAVSGSTVYAGGLFTSTGGQPRHNIAALDASTGTATAWNPGADNWVSALAVSGSTVYAGGRFTSIGGQARQDIAALDAGTGMATAWNPGANGGVRALALLGSTVYAGGEFTSIGGQVRHRVAALDAGTGKATAWNPNANGPVSVLAGSGHIVYAGGEFTSVGGRDRHHVAAVDAGTGTATAWNPRANASVNALVVSGRTVYAGGTFESVGGQARDGIAALDANTGKATAWNPDGGPVSALAVSGGIVYAGGFFTSIGGQAREKIAALDASTGMATTWNPNVGSYSDAEVLALAASGQTVYAGGDFNSIAGRPHQGFAEFAKPIHFGISQPRTYADGTITFSAHLPVPARVQVMVTAWNNNLARTSLLQPAARRFVFARQGSGAHGAGTLRVRVHPNARGNVLVHDHRYRVTLRLWVTFTPTEGHSGSSLGFYGLHLPEPRTRHRLAVTHPR